MVLSLPPWTNRLTFTWCFLKLGFWVQYRYQSFMSFHYQTSTILILYGSFVHTFAVYFNPHQFDTVRYELVVKIRFLYTKLNYANEDIFLQGFDCRWNFKTRRGVIRCGSHASYVHIIYYQLKAIPQYKCVSREEDGPPSFRPTQRLSQVVFSNENCMMSSVSSIQVDKLHACILQQQWDFFQNFTFCLLQVDTAIEV